MNIKTSEPHSVVFMSNFIEISNKLPPRTKRVRIKKIRSKHYQHFIRHCHYLFNRRLKRKKNKTWAIPSNPFLLLEDLRTTSRCCWSLLNEMVYSKPFRCMLTMQTGTGTMNSPVSLWFVVHLFPQRSPPWFRSADRAPKYVDSNRLKWTENMKLIWWQNKWRSELSWCHLPASSLLKCPTSSSRIVKLPPLLLSYEMSLRSHTSENKTRSTPGPKLEQNIISLWSFFRFGAGLGKTCLKIILEGSGSCQLVWTLIQK